MADATTNDTADESERAAIVFSGGPDSTAAALWALEEGYEPELISYRFDDDEQYGEMRAAIKIAEKLDIEHTIIDFKGPLQTAFGANAKMFRHAGVKGALKEADADETDLPERSEGEDHLAPFASGILLSLTASYALYNGIHNVVWGATKDDSQTDVTYQEGFARNLADMIESAVGTPLDIHVPLDGLHKHEIIGQTYGDEELFAQTWSCKEPVGDTQCGTCHACVARRTAARMAGVEDNSPYHEDEYESPFTEEEFENPSEVPAQKLSDEYKTI